MFWAIIILVFVVAIGSIIFQDNCETKKKIKKERSKPSLVESDSKLESEKFSYALKLKKTSISVEEFEKVKDSMNSKFTFNDVLWAVYNKKSLEYFFEQSFGLYRNILLEMSSFLRKEKRYKDELQFLLKVLYCDLSGNSNGGTIEDKDSIDIYPGIFKKIKKNNEQYTERMIDNCFKIPFIFNYCDRELFVEILNEVLNLKEYNENILEKYYPRMKERPKSDLEIEFEELYN